MDDMFKVPPELVSENASKHKDSKSMTNYNVSTVIQTIVDRLNDIHNVVLAIEGFDVETQKILLSSNNLNATTTLRYVNLINILTIAIQKNVKNIEKRLSLNYNQNG